jgi:hypothetical protein
MALNQGVDRKDTVDIVWDGKLLILIHFHDGNLTLTPDLQAKVS